MWQSILKYLGVELGKALLIAIKDWYQEYQLRKQQAKEDARLKEKEKLFIAIEAARITGNTSELERLTRELYKLQRD
jgi:hypothetical protein